MSEAVGGGCLRRTFPDLSAEEGFGGRVDYGLGFLDASLTVDARDPFRTSPTVGPLVIDLLPSTACEAMKRSAQAGPVVDDGTTRLRVRVRRSLVGLLDARHLAELVGRALGRLRAILSQHTVVTDEQTQLLRGLLTVMVALNELSHTRYAGRVLLAIALTGGECSDDAMARTASIPVEKVWEIILTMLDRCLQVPALLVAKRARTAAGGSYDGTRLTAEGQRRVGVLRTVWFTCDGLAAEVDSE